MASDKEIQLCPSLEKAGRDRANYTKDTSLRRVCTFSQRVRHIYVGRAKYNGKAYNED